MNINILFLMKILNEHYTLILINTIWILNLYNCYIKDLNTSISFMGGTIKVSSCSLRSDHNLKPSQRDEISFTI